MEVPKHAAAIRCQNGDVLYALFERYAYMWMCVAIGSGETVLAEMHQRASRLQPNKNKSVPPAVKKCGDEWLAKLAAPSTLLDRPVSIQLGKDAGEEGSRDNRLLHVLKEQGRQDLVDHLKRKREFSASLSLHGDLISSLYNGQVPGMGPHYAVNWTQVPVKGYDNESRPIFAKIRADLGYDPCAKPECGIPLLSLILHEGVAIL